LAIDLGAKYKIKYGFGLDLRYSYGFDDLGYVISIDPNGSVIGKARIGSNRVFQLGIFYDFSQS